eukprot:Anaeramoba_ignava/c19779_g2_i1.p1 GENE.c19779_g2_i1~~c19779_g2_i1.p1  ORF type:complete len:162 (+),score=75.13 c19779_g2_i1:65-550(+)
MGNFEQSNTENLEEEKRQKIEIPSPPKKPLNAYFLFAQDCRPRIKEQNPEIKGSEITKMIGQEWKNLPQEQKDVYKNKQQQLQEIYNKEIAEYLIKYPPTAQVSISDEEDESIETAEDESDQDYQDKVPEIDSDAEKDEYYEYLETDDTDSHDSDSDSDSD